MSRATIARLSRALAELKARQVSQDAPRIVAAELCAIGCHATAWRNETHQGVTVETWDTEPEIDAARERKLAELEAKGISTFVVVIDRLEDRPNDGDVHGPSTEHASGTAETAKASEGDRGGGDNTRSTTPHRLGHPGARVTDPTTSKGNKHG